MRIGSFSGPALAKRTARLGMAGDAVPSIERRPRAEMNLPENAIEATSLVKTYPGVTAKVRCTP